MISIGLFGLTKVVKLAVPLIAQDEEFWCVPACIKMVIEYMNGGGRMTVPIPSLTLREIARIVKTEDGTRAHQVPLMNPRMEEAVPSVEFEDDYKVRMVDEIEDENKNLRPTIAWMTLTDGIHRNWGHAVVITDIDRAMNRITYNDPGPPRENTQPLSAFETVWERSYTTLVKIQIGKKTRTVLTQFTEQEKQ
ncbi:MAG: C39 family peptidase [Nitrososphaerota archaeon]|nr:C39 family peptidase [Nitrososphaerota archaeon]